MVDLVVAVSVRKESGSGRGSAFLNHPGQIVFMSQVKDWALNNMWYI